MTSTFLMNPYTGSVDTKAQWLAEMNTWEVYHPDDEHLFTPEQKSAERQRQFDSLVEVKKVDGSWVDV